MRRLLKLCAGLSLVLWAAPLRAVDVCKAPGESVTKFGARFTGMHARVDGQRRQAVLSHPDPQAPARYLRLRIVLEQPADAAWELVLRDNNFRPLQVVGPADFKAGSNSMWSRRLARELLPLSGECQKAEPIRTVKLDLWSPGDYPKLSVQEYIAMPERTEHPFYSVQGSQPLWRDLFTDTGTDAWKRAGDAVGMLVGGRQSDTWCCSGVVVQREPRVLFLTNFHCGAPDPALADSAFWSGDVCASTVVDFSWDGDKTSREFACAHVAARDADRDMVLLELKPLGVDPAPTPSPLHLGPADEVEDLVVLHHPECRTKQISRGCSMEDRAVAGWRSNSGKSDFTHLCDTEAGSSGAPVFDGQGRLVGIHHLGFEVKNGTCDQLNKGVWLKAGRAKLLKAGVQLPTAGNGGP